jgi:hypothetical protein
MVATPMMIVCGLLFAGSSAWADDGQPTCTLKTLKGRYLFADKGTALPPFGQVTGPTPSSVAGFHHFKGDRSGYDTITLVVNGVPVFRNAAVPFTYTVNADCTGTITTQISGGGPRFDIFVAPNGDAVATIGVDPGNYFSNISQRVSPMYP